MGFLEAVVLPGGKKKMNKINKVISISLKLSEWGKMKDTSMDLPWRTRERKNRATLSNHYLYSFCKGQNPAEGIEGLLPKKVIVRI